MQIQPVFGWLATSSFTLHLGHLTSLKSNVLPVNWRSCTMPVSPKYTWCQSDTHVEIDVEISRITLQKPEVFGTSALVKVVAHPYFLLVDLAHDVKFEKGVAVVKPGKIHFSLPKVGSNPVFVSLRGAPSTQKFIASGHGPPACNPCAFVEAHVRPGQPDDAVLPSSWILK